MSKPAVSTDKSAIIGRLILACCLVVLVSLVLPALVWAEGPPSGPGDTGSGTPKCAECHPQEMETWSNSPHAQVKLADGSVGVTCEDCHGTYVEGHPEKGLMQLSTDSSVCKSCHAQAYEKWAISAHGRLNVQCIGCHIAHSQGLRLTDNALCTACHQKPPTDLAHTSHSQAGVVCVSCHASTASAQAAAAAMPAADAESDHDFMATSSLPCVNCHDKTPASSTTDTASDRAVGPAAAATANQPSEPVTTAETQERPAQILQIMPFVTLGLGMGIGGILGIVFMLTIGYINHGRAKR
jgi:formate-dependent nitrite reductase cytochrome c552 subunit